MAVVYVSGPDYSGDTPTMWRQEGELPPCVELSHEGEFLCKCGRHRVQANMGVDPLDSQPRMTCTVTLI